MAHILRFIKFNTNSLHKMLLKCKKMYYQGKVSSEAAERPFPQYGNRWRWQLQSSGLERLRLGVAGSLRRNHRQNRHHDDNVSKVRILFQYLEILSTIRYFLWDLGDCKFLARSVAFKLAWFILILNYFQMVNKLNK